MDPIMCPNGHLYDPQLLQCPKCSHISGPSVPIIHLLIGAGVGFYTWHKTQSTLFAAVAGIASAWFFGTKLGRLVALLAILALLALLFFAH